MTNQHLAATRRTTIIMRDSVDFFGPRLVTDDAAALTVRAFAFADIAAVTAVRRGLRHAGEAPAACIEE
jgi:hypothetical protein